MSLLKQLELTFWRRPTPSQNGRALELEPEAQRLLTDLGASALARDLRIEWNARLRSAAGRAVYRDRLIVLNRRLRDHGYAEIDRTVRHELAHLLAQSRAGRHRIAPHGAEWRAACCDLGIPGEARCHTLPFPVNRRRRPYMYSCGCCGTEFPRMRRIRRAIACLACCRKFNGGAFDPRFRLLLVSESRLRNLSRVTR